MYKLYAILNDKNERYTYENEVTGFMFTNSGDMLLNCKDGKQIYYPNHSWVSIELTQPRDVKTNKLLVIDNSDHYSITSYQIDKQTGIVQAFVQSSEDEPAEAVYIFNPTNFDFITVNEIE